MAWRGVTIFGSLLQHPIQDLMDLVRQPRPQFIERIRLFRLMADEFLNVRPAGEWRLAGEAVVERAAERIDVGADIDVARVARLFRRDKVRCAEQSSSPRQWGVFLLRPIFL